MNERSLTLASVGLGAGIMYLVGLDADRRRGTRLARLRSLPRRGRQALAVVTGVLLVALSSPYQTKRGVAARRLGMGLLLRGVPPF